MAFGNGILRLFALLSILNISLGMSNSINMTDIEYNLQPNAPLYVNGDTPHFFEWYPNIFIKILHCDPNTGNWAVILKAEPGAHLNIHHHLGTVYGYTLSGVWGYQETSEEWMNTAGDFMLVTTGAKHTFYVPQDSPQAMEAFFIIYGALEFVDANGKTIAIEDWISISRKYYQWCKDNNIVPYDVTGVRGKAIDATFKKREKEDTKIDL